MLPLPMDFGLDKPNDRLVGAFRDDIDAYIEREVLPHVPDAWVDYGKTKVGYEIPVNRHFYVYKPPRPLDQIEADITKPRRGDRRAARRDLWHELLRAPSDELVVQMGGCRSPRYGWGSNWLKWSVDLSTKRPTEEEQKALPLHRQSPRISHSWTGIEEIGRMIEEPKLRREANSRTFQKRRCSDLNSTLLSPYLRQGLPRDIRRSLSLQRRIALLVGPNDAAGAAGSSSDVLVSKSETVHVDTIVCPKLRRGQAMPRADQCQRDCRPLTSLPLPSLDTQRRIAAFSGREDGADRRADREEACALGAAGREALGPHHPSRHPGPSTRKPRRNPPVSTGSATSLRIGEVKRLRFLLTGGTLNGLYKPKEAFDPEGIPFVQMGEAFRSPVFDGGTEDCVHASNDEIEKWGLMNGDFLIARRSIVFEGSGKSVLVSGLRGPHLFESSMIRIRLQKPATSFEVPVVLLPVAHRARIRVVRDQESHDQWDRQSAAEVYPYSRPTRFRGA